MAKRKTKQQQEDEARAALLQRVTDIVTTAAWGVIDEGEAVFLADYPRLLSAVKTLLIPDGAETYLTSPSNAEKYADPETLTDFLFKGGIRA